MNNPTFRSNFQRKTHINQPVASSRSNLFECKKAVRNLVYNDVDPCAMLHTGAGISDFGLYPEGMHRRTDTDRSFGQVFTKIQDETLIYIPKTVSDQVVVFL